MKSVMPKPLVDSVLLTCLYAKWQAQDPRFATLLEQSRVRMRRALRQQTQGEAQ